jgi:putative phage-type endonuclease
MDPDYEPSTSDPTSSDPETESTSVSNEQGTELIHELSNQEFDELETTVHEMTDDYVRTHVLNMSDPNFHPILIDEITTIMFDMWMNIDLCNQHDYDDIQDYIRIFIDDYFERGYGSVYVPVRSRKTAAPVKPNSITDTQFITEKIIALQDRNANLPAQRTPEWYAFRHSLITASNIGKLFGTEAQRNSLIYEKCKPFEDAQEGWGNVNTQSPMHWGQKYEPVTRMIYEDMFGTRVSDDFGCIRHATVPCIGASPDGVNVEPLSDRYGRMIEIKNIVNREINGIPSKAYWIQMQVQMETCDLDECDFMETQICEYKEGEEEFWGDPVPREYKGVVLYFVERVSIGDINSASNCTNVPRYEYMPLSVELTKEAVDEWIATTRQQLRRGWSLYTTLWWYLSDYSCVLVERNRAWFETARPLVEDTWTTILRERETGYEHRSAKKRSVKESNDGAKENTMITVMRLSDNDANCEGVDCVSPRKLKYTGKSSGSICLVKLE